MMNVNQKRLLNLLFENSFRFTTTIRSWIMTCYTEGSITSKDTIELFSILRKLPFIDDRFRTVEMAIDRINSELKEELKLENMTQEPKFKLGDVVTHAAGSYLTHKMLVIGVGEMTTYEGSGVIYLVSIEKQDQITRAILNEYEIKLYEK